MYGIVFAIKSAVPPAVANWSESTILVQTVLTTHRRNQYNRVDDDEGTQNVQTSAGNEYAGEIAFFGSGRSTTKPQPFSEERQSASNKNRSSCILECAHAVSSTTPHAVAVTAPGHVHRLRPRSAFEPSLGDDWQAANDIAGRLLGLDAILVAVEVLSVCSSLR